VTVRGSARLSPSSPRPLLLLVIDSLHGGGAERYVVDLALALRQRGWGVEVACSTGGVREEALTRGSVPVHVLGRRLVKRRICPSYARALRRLVVARQPALVHAHLYASGVAAVRATAGLDIPLVVTEHTEGPWRTAPARLVSRELYAGCDRLVAVSNAIRRMLVEQYAVPPERVRTLLPRPSAVASPVPRPPAAPVQVGVAARLVPEKGVDVFLRAVARVAPVVPQARFVVLGDGPVAGELRRLTGELGVDGVVAFPGFCPDAAQRIVELDLLVVPSLSDGSPLVVGEAMQGGVPVVASRVGGLPDLVTDGRTGLLVTPGQVDELAAALITLVLDGERRRRMGHAARRAALTDTHAAMVSAMEGVYADVLDGVRVAA
jgi:glycosyltransferase involved in cell wall biosynthesis